MALCGAVCLLEWALVSVFEPGARASLAPQAGAVAPFGVFHDLRWIAVGHNSWPSLGAELSAMVAGRALLGALAIRLVWPEGRRRPPWSRLLWRGVAASAMAAVLLVPSASLVFGLAVVPVSWLFLAAVPLAVLVALIIHPVALSPGWWRHTVPLRAVAWMLLTFVVLSAAGAVVAAVPWWAGALVALASGGFNALAWRGTVHAVVDRDPWRFPVPVIPASLAALVALVVLGATFGFMGARPSHRAAAASPPAHGGQPVLVVSGYGSSYRGSGTGTAPLPGAFTERRFSYRGLAPDHQPLAYSAHDTVKPLSTLDRMMAEQIEALAGDTGRRVDVVAESEGALVAKTTLLAWPRLPVKALVMASPLLVPGQTTYPQDTTGGWGVGTSVLMGAIGSAFHSVSPVNLSPDNAFLASIDEQASVLRQAASCPLAGVRQLAILPLADATVTPPGAASRLDQVVVVAFHGGILGQPAYANVVAQFLDGHQPQKDRLLALADDAIRFASVAWQVPGGPGSSSPATCSAAGRRLARAAFGP
jgi:hypothetical protein